MSATIDKFANITVPITAFFVDWSSGYPEQTPSVLHRIGVLRYASYFCLMSAVGHWAILRFWDKYTTELA